MQLPLQELETTYFTLQQQIGSLGDACQTQVQRDALSTQYVQARQNYWNCVNKAFHDDDPVVISLTNRVEAANQQIAHLDTQLEGIAKIIDDITSAVKLGTQIAAKVIAV
jgi:hypothetical protein